MIVAFLVLKKIEIELTLLLTAQYGKKRRRLQVSALGQQLRSGKLDEAQNQHVTKDKERRKLLFLTFSLFHFTQRKPQLIITFLY